MLFETRLRQNSSSVRTIALVFGCFLTVSAANAFGQTHPIAGYGYDATNDSYFSYDDADSIDDYLASSAETDVSALQMAYFLSPSQQTLNAWVTGMSHDVDKDGHVATADATAVTDYLAQLPFTNPGTYADAQFDVNNDGYFTALDMLQFYNEFSSRPGGENRLRLDGYYFDVNGDNYLTSLDYLMIYERYQEN